MNYDLGVADPVFPPSDGGHVWPTKIPGLNLRALQTEDCARLARIVDQHRRFLERGLAWVRQNPSVDGLRKFLEIAATETALRNAYHAVILLGPDPIGMVGLFWAEATERRARLTYWLQPRATGRGYATAAVSAWIGIAFSSLPLDLIESRVDPGNAPSRRLCRRLGFAEIGLLSAEEWSGEDFADVIVYRVQREDWPLFGPNRPTHNV